MKPDPMNWQQLATQARAGEVEAAVQLRDELAPQMVRLVRRALRGGGRSSALERQILDEANSVHRHHPDQRRDSEELVRLVTQRLCARLLQGQTRPYLATAGRPETIGA